MQKPARLLALLAVAALTALTIAPADPAVAAGNEVSTAADARAAAGVTAAAVDTTGVVASFSSGTMVARETKSFRWSDNGTSVNTVYSVGLTPSGATTAARCLFSVVRSWYVQRPGAAREFHFTINNDSSISCRTVITLAATESFRSWSATINPGVSRSWAWNNAHLADSIYLVGVSPNGASATQACEYEVTRRMYAEQPSGVREFRLTVRNSGTIACTANMHLAKLASTKVSPPTYILNAGRGGTINVDHMGNSVLLPGLTPTGATAEAACVFELRGPWFEQTLSATGTIERQAYVVVENIGGITCGTPVRSTSIS